MSVILRNNSNSSSGGIGGSGDGFPPGDVDIIANSISDSEVWVKWSDPDNTIINGSTISTWAGTVLVRKIGSYPESVEDGTIVIKNTTRNIFQDIWFKDIGLTNETTYYYRFFPYNTEGVYNNSSNLVFTATPLSISGIFSDNTWAQIISAIETDTVPDTWNVGDEKTLELSGAYNMTITLQIWDFNHFDKSDGSGKANICFGCKDIYIMEQMNTINSFIGGWANMPMRNTVMQNIYNSMPYELQNAIKEVTIEYNPGGTSNIYTCNDKVFIPSINEVGIPDTPSFGTAFPIFSDDTSRMKYDMRPNGSGDPDFWWTRTAYDYSTDYFLAVYPNGYYDCYTITYTEGAVFCFNI